MVARLAEAEFWALTLTELHALAERAAELGQRGDYRAGVVAAVVANAQRGSASDRVWEPADFFPALSRRGTADDDGEMSDEQIAATLGALWGG